MAIGCLMASAPLPCLSSPTDARALLGRIPMHPVHSPQKIFTAYPLPDAGLMLAPSKQKDQALVLRMAEVLIATNTFSDHRASFVVLILHGFKSYEVACLIDDARQYAV